MTDIAASVLARLKKQAVVSGRSYQLCLQLFCQEEFLRQLEPNTTAQSPSSIRWRGSLTVFSNS